MPSFDELQAEAYRHAEAAGFHASREGIPEHLRRIVSCGLIGTEVSEAIEAARHDDDDNYMGELADAVIRIMDEAEIVYRAGITFDGAKTLSLYEWIVRKQEINRSRPMLHGKNT